MLDLKGCGMLVPSTIFEQECDTSRRPPSRKGGLHYGYLFTSHEGVNRNTLDLAATRASLKSFYILQLTLATADLPSRVH